MFAMGMSNARDRSRSLGWRLQRVHHSPAGRRASTRQSTEIALAESILVESVPGKMLEYREDAINLVAQFGNGVRGVEDSYFPIT